MLMEEFARIGKSSESTTAILIDAKDFFIKWNLAPGRQRTRIATTELWMPTTHWQDVRATAEVLQGQIIRV